MISIVVAFLTCVVPAQADELLFAYEGDVFPSEPGTGWLVFNECDSGCLAANLDRKLVLRWDTSGDTVDYTHRVVEPPGPSLPTLWVEWRFASNTALGSNPICDGRFFVDYSNVDDWIAMFGDAIVSSSGDKALTGLPIETFRTFAFASEDGNSYCFYVDGSPFRCSNDQTGSDGTDTIKIVGRGGCILPTVNKWDFVRYGTIAFGEQIVESTPAVGFIDARTSVPFDRFTVRYDEPNYVLVDEITVETTGGEIPVVTKTRRLDNGPPDVVEIVLDRPIPFGETTTFIFNDGVAVNSIKFTFAPGDTDGDGDADLRDAARFQNCFGTSELTGACHALDSSPNATIDTRDYADFNVALLGPSDKAS